ncbi:MAG TPA: hypothetical protein VFS67_05590 [Polyangiaceae bacterium]|jgi:hypothetical protein|nr:hypothetical protein [Polyangiaceae bacterium]
MSDLHDLVLIVHSFTRWCVLVACAGAVLHASGLGRAQHDPRVGRLLVGLVDLQVLLGMTLYWGLSPLARAARQLWADRGFLALWARPELRFFGLIHPALALSAALAAHAGWVAVQRARTPEQRRRRLAAGAALALLLFSSAVPWPVLGHDRPWFRF